MNKHHFFIILQNSTNLKRMCIVLPFFLSLPTRKQKYEEKKKRDLYKETEKWINVTKFSAHSHGFYAKQDGRADAKQDGRADTKHEAGADAKQDGRADVKHDAGADASSQKQTDAFSIPILVIYYFKFNNNAEDFISSVLKTTWN